MLSASHVLISFTNGKQCFQRGKSYNSKRKLEVTRDFIKRKVQLDGFSN